MRRLIAGAGLAGLVVSTLAIGARATTSEGTLDPTYGVGGAVVIDGGGVEATLNDVEIRSDGKAVAVGRYGRIIQLDSFGSPDNGFGTGGIVVLPGSPTLWSLAIQPDGRIIVAGGEIVARMKPDGTLDGTFGVGGDDGNGIVTLHGFYLIEMKLQSDGAIVVVGLTGDCSTTCDGSVARMKPDGTLDGTFGVGGDDGNGVVTFANKPVVLTAIQSDGKIIVAGGEIVTRMKPDGTLDGTFGVGGDDGNGVVTISGVGSLGSLVLTHDEKIFVAGLAGPGLRVARLDVDGTLDETFGTGGDDGNGINTISIGAGDHFFNDAVIQTDGRVVVAGERSFGGSPRLAVVRIKPDGSLDTGFGTGGDDGDGWITYSGPTAADRAQALGVQPDNKIVAVGQTRTGNYKILALRIEAVSTASTLRNLALSTGTLAETFAGATTSYTASVPNTVKSITVTPTAVDLNAVITVNNVTTATGSASAPISLVAGANFVNLRVTAQDGVTEKIYTITVTRRNATVKVKKTMTAKAAMASVDKTIPRGAKVRITVARSSGKSCSATSSSIRGLRKGTCTVTIAVTPPPTRQVKKPTTTRTTVTITVS